MKLETYLDTLTKEKREQLLGVETLDVLHAAFPKKRVVHAGLMGEAVPREAWQEVWRGVMDQPPDLSRQHAVYIHIPFCQTRCLYCGFFQNASSQRAEDAYVDALLTEMARDASARQLRGTPIDAVFLGGGTPTSLSARNIARLLAAVRQAFTLRPDCEWTLEGRIHDLVPEKIDAWLSVGINRISLGIQSFHTELRRRVGRIDRREEVLRRLALLHSYDVTVIGDLIFGLPGETLEAWLEDVQTALSAPLDGMDLYQLNVYPGGRLDRAVQAGEVPPCADLPMQAEMYAAARAFLVARGVDRLSICHWRKSKRERSLYNSMAKAGAVIHPFGCGAGGNTGGCSLMLQRELGAYERGIAAGEKPIMMLAAQPAPALLSLSNQLIDGMEHGRVDVHRLEQCDARCGGLRTVLELWRRRGLLLREESGAYRLTSAGEFWYVTISQSLVECLQVLLDGGAAPMVAAKGKVLKGRALDEMLARMVPERQAEARRAALG